MAASMKNASILVDALDIYAQLLLQQVYFLVHRQRLWRQTVNTFIYLLEYPRASKCGTSNHYGIDTIAVERLLGLPGAGDVAIADDGDMYARIVLHLAYERPVGLTSIHLAARAPVDGESLYAAVLKLLGKGCDDKVLAVPSQSRLHGYGHLDSLDNLSGNVEHQRYVAEHSCSCSLAGNLLDRTTEVDVDDVGRCLLDYPCSLNHVLYRPSVYLYSHRTLLVADGKFADR